MGKYLTIWKKVDFEMDSGYGKIDYEEWCVREAKRIGDCVVKYRNRKDKDTHNTKIRECAVMRT